MLEIFGHWGAVALSLVHFPLAVAVTLHVLFNKREVGSAIAWIGLAWLSPFVGSLLYLLFGINRVRRRATQFRGVENSRATAVLPGEPNCDDHLFALERAGGQITRRPTEPGNAISLLQNGDQAYPEMLAAIRAAQVSIALCSYLFRSDVIGRTFIDALDDAHRRGVGVRVLIDGVGSGYFLTPTYWQLRRRGIKVVRFMHSPLPWRMPFINLRTHKKLLVVDGRVAFMGGLNIGDENVVANSPAHPVRDTHFRVEGPVVRQLMESFARDWLFTAGETLADITWFPQRSEAVGQIMARAVLSGPDTDIEKIEFLMLEAIGCAQSSIRIMTPYFLPEDRLITALSLAALRGVDVRIVIPRQSNRRVVDWATRSHIAPLLVAGCRIWENPPPFEHSKLMTIDGAWGLVGSANWDMRSFRLNFELNIETYDHNLAQQIDALIASKQRTPVTEASLDARSFVAELIGNGARLMLPYL
ncbi:MAG TPA: cardiolipin synthase [Stellaceae bacterium]|nr:cardiolipin synthase [Stellaceae bacterium]